MNCKQLSTLINSALLPNRMNVNATALAEDLSNYVDVGVVLSSMTGTDLQDFQRMLAVGVRNMAVFDDVYDPDTYGIYKNVENFGKAIQRVAIKNLPTVQDSHAINLVNGQNYLDGKYYGAEFDSRIYIDTKTFKVSYSWSDDTWEKCVADVDEMNTLLTQWLNAVQSQLNNINKGIVDMTINKRIVDCLNNGKVVGLVSAYNTEFGVTETYTTIKADEAKARRFSEFCTGVIRIIERGLEEFDKKYNDGTVNVYTPSRRISSIFLTQFVNDIQNYGLTTIFHNEELGLGKVYDKLSWQTSGTAMLPQYTTTGVIVDGDSQSSNTYGDTAPIVGIIFDNDSMGVTDKFNKITTEYIGSEGYTTYHHHVAVDNYTDGRGNGVVFTLG